MLRSNADRTRAALGGMSVLLTEEFHDFPANSELVRAGRPPSPSSHSLPDHKKRTNCTHSYLITYSMEHTPSWEANWFCS
jgi:hypothetical protein